MCVIALMFPSLVVLPEVFRPKNPCHRPTIWCAPSSTPPRMMPCACQACNLAVKHEGFQKWDPQMDDIPLMHLINVGYHTWMMVYTGKCHWHLNDLGNSGTRTWGYRGYHQELMGQVDTSANKHEHCSKHVFFFADSMGYDGIYMGDKAKTRSGKLWQQVIVQQWEG